MGSNLAKRLADLNTQTDLDSIRRLGVVKTTAIVVVVLLFLALFLGVFFKSTDRNQAARPDLRKLNDVEILQLQREDIARWRRGLQQRVETRYQWLDNSLYGDSFAETYFSFARSVANNFSYTPTLAPKESVASSINRVLRYDDWFISFSQGTTEALLCCGFVILAFWPFWIFGVIAGYVGGRRMVKPRITFDVLGICNRGGGPFYSGIYGPFRPNHGPSATNYSAPNLACPAKASSAEAVRHPAAQILRDYSALNQTNLELISVILAYRDYPAFADILKQADEEQEDEKILSTEPHPSLSGYVTNERGTIEEATRDGLEGILKAHQLLQRYFRSLGPEASPDTSNISYAEFSADIKRLCDGVDVLTKTLVLTLTPERARALADLPSRVVASAYLAIEAGKSLVYKRVDSGFTQISKFPHLQARAVIQSLAAYHKEYQGDLRMIIRQAIITSRRHEDFGRAFLPNLMLMASRGLRDQLEILYDHPDKRSDSANLVELDAHIEEIGNIWKTEFVEKIKDAHRTEEVEGKKGTISLLWKGLVHKSVVLLPLEYVLRIALSRIDDVRKARISHLLNCTKSKQANLSICARLPGFKRQALEAEESGIQKGNASETLLSLENGKTMLAHWLIVRRVLTRFNWLSTRVGDDAVPSDSLVQGLLIDREGDEKPHVIGLEALVPLRQRRLKELFGPKWEWTYYRNMPHPADVEVFVNTEGFAKSLKERMDQAERGLLKRRPPLPQQIAVGDE